MDAWTFSKLERLTWNNSYMIFRLYTKIHKENSVQFPNLVCTSL